MKRTFRSLLLRTAESKPATVAGFPIEEWSRGQNGAKRKFLNMLYRPAEIYPLDSLKNEQDRLLARKQITFHEHQANCAAIPEKALAVDKWYVFYSYKHPATGKLHRRKVYEDINRQTIERKIEYAKLLRDATNVALAAGYNPFSADMEEEAKVIEQIKRREEIVVKERTGDRSHFTMLQAMAYFIKLCKDRKLDETTLNRYNTGLRYLKNWMNDREMLLVKARDITSTDIMDCLSENERNAQWTGRTYNNHLQNMHTLFNTLSKSIHGIVEKNPIQGAEIRQTVTNTHSVYNDKQLSYILSSVRRKKDYFMEGLILTCYYAAVRAKEEMINFRAGNVNYERDLILLDGDYTKARREDYIPLDPELKRHFIERGYDKLPPDYYIFGRGGKPSKSRAPYNNYAKAFKVYREEFGLDRRYTLYGMKHTRAVHLAMAGVDIYAIMVLFRHRDVSVTVVYLRELGATINREATKGSRII